MLPKLDIHPLPRNKFADLQSINVARFHPLPRFRSGNYEFRPLKPTSTASQQILLERTSRRPWFVRWISSPSGSAIALPAFQFVKRDETEFDWVNVISQISPGNQLGMNFQ
jgi:hypothetical protein